MSIVFDYRVCRAIISPREVLSPLRAAKRVAPIDDSRIIRDACRRTYAILTSLINLCNLQAIEFKTPVTLT